MIEVNYRKILVALFAVAFLIRLAVRMSFGETYFWVNSYSAYYDLAENIISGKGFCFDATCAWWPPVYPLFLALTALGGKHYLLIVVPQAMMGAGTALCAFLIGRELFNTLVGILACAITAIYPYYVMHDTALQETGMVTFWVALSVYLLLRASKLNRKRDWFLAGLALGLVALTRASIAPAAGVALIWTAVWGVRGDLRTRLLKTSILLFAILITVGPWLIRTYRLTGAVVISSQTGRALWIGNNPQTFSAYPSRSIDVSTGNAYVALSDADKETLDRLGGHEIQQSNWYSQKALMFIRTHPWLTVQRAVRKIETGFSWRLNPVREPLAQAAYAVFYAPIALLGVIGMFVERRNRGVILIGLLFVAFIFVTAVFWAHTSHRSYLDVFFIVLAASVVERLLARYAMRRKESVPWQTTP
jgi:4-amino-4-deoxy-L-arabinose transferase-like glycosyltransferase